MHAEYQAEFITFNLIATAILGGEHRFQDQYFEFFLSTCY